VVILGTVFSRLIFAVHAAPQIKGVTDLKGKSIAGATSAETAISPVNYSCRGLVWCRTKTSSSVP
jgi:hypothetical protein